FIDHPNTVHNTSPTSSQTQPTQHTYTDINGHFIYLGELIRRHKELFPRYPAGHHIIHIPQDLSP
ncbi:hypothetical protein LINPERPRIM_LOCUS20156, partial [Linum perenne]